MVRVYKRTSNRGSWMVPELEKALKLVQNGSMTIRKAAITFNIPRETFRRRMEQFRKGVSLTNRLGRFNTVFPMELEDELAEHLLLMESRLFGLNCLDVRRLAYQLAVKNDLPNNFCKETGLAGKDWLEGFRKRHPQLSLRTPEKTSISRTRCFNKPTVEKFFKMLQEVIDEKTFPPHRLYNMDETAITTVQSRPSRILAKKGKKQIGALTSAERGVLNTAVICMSATGNFVPPMLIYPRVRMKEELECGAPNGTLFRAHPSGWMQSDLFVDWFKHFIQYTKPMASDPVLLILDGHASHTKNLEFLELARDNCVTVISLPPHCTHRLQPLDVSLMGPLKTYYNKAIEKFHRITNGQPVRQVNIAALFGEAYKKAAVAETAENGFRQCGIYPLQMSVFRDEDFSPAETSNVSLETPDEQPVKKEKIDTSAVLQSNELKMERITTEDKQSITSMDQPPTVKQMKVSTSDKQSCEPEIQRTTEEQKITRPTSVSQTPEDDDSDYEFVGFEEGSFIPFSKHVLNNQSQAQPEQIGNPRKLLIRPSDIMPLPQLKERAVQTRGRAPEKAAVLTSDEFTNNLRLKKMKKVQAPDKGKVSKCGSAIEKDTENLPPLMSSSRRKRKKPMEATICRKTKML